LVALRTFIERESDQRAALAVERIMDSIEVLADQPAFGRPGKLEGTREFVVLRHNRKE
jgi:plasmid stabilization system protein ParE